MTAPHDPYIQDVQSLITGVQKHIPNLALILGSKNYTGAQLVADLQALVTSATAVNTTRTAWLDAVQSNRALTEANTGLLSDLRAAIQAMFGNNQSVLADFGLVPRKEPKPLTIEQKAARAAKSAATRLARGTSSKKKKATVTGNVSGVQITPITGATGTPTTPGSTATTSPPAATGSGAPATTPATAPQPPAAGTGGASPGGGHS